MTYGDISSSFRNKFVRGAPVKNNNLINTRRYLADGARQDAS